MRPPLPLPPLPLPPLTLPPLLTPPSTLPKQTLEEYEYAVEDGRVPDFLGVAKPGPAPPVAPRTYTPAPPPSALPPPSPPKPTHQNPQYLSRTLPLGTSVLAKSTPRPSQEAGAGAARAKRADDDEVDGLVEQAGEDELEQLLRELEGN